MDAYRFTGPRIEGETWTARHQRMVNALPEEGGTIVVVTNEIGRHLMRGIRVCRGFAVRRKWRFVRVRTYADCDQVEGLRGVVIIDWTVVEHAKPDAQRRLRVLVAGIEAMTPPVGIDAERATCGA